VTFLAEIIKLLLSGRHVRLLLPVFLCLPTFRFGCKSDFSFLELASHPDELIEEADRLGLPALAFTDRNGV
jgi:hypothetical protein